MTLLKVAAHPCRACGHDSATLMNKQGRPGYQIQWRVVCGFSVCGAIGPWSNTDTGAVMRWNDARSGAKANKEFAA
jgi:hypothetical protein